MHVAFKQPGGPGTATGPWRPGQLVGQGPPGLRQTAGCAPWPCRTRTRGAEQRPSARPSGHPASRRGTKAWTPLFHPRFPLRGRVATPHPPVLSCSSAPSSQDRHLPPRPTGPTPPDSLAHGTLDLSPGMLTSHLSPGLPKHDLPLAQCPPGWPPIPVRHITHSMSSSGRKAYRW